MGEACMDVIDQIQHYIDSGEFTVLMPGLDGDYHVAVRFQENHDECGDGVTEPVVWIGDGRKCMSLNCVDISDVRVLHKDAWVRAATYVTEEPQP